MAHYGINGLGDHNARFRVYIGNRPDHEFGKAGIVALTQEDILRIGQHCGNGWRKVFNVYAKLAFTLPPSFGFKRNFRSWQQYRDNSLLQQGSNTALLFTPPDLTNRPDCVHIVMGRTYAKSLDLGEGLRWINPEFAVDHTKRLIVCPYFDYRQLSNIKILFLSDLIERTFFELFIQRSIG
ncbi:DUF6942 family protein [Lacimicrobium alkaliphilum]|uniref:Uncharacterized protein n=1 Tax=Lacimicrobium alkaliphilum TaxID=1526571 RepID=A0A0U3AVP1_9ALTE|nr:hypothetical protein [Lacimicrobium alkaliphilum]ALS98159.1 hypothetical protein AT746_07735 [Lacimicrobium alkaliphilum]